MAHPQFEAVNLNSAPIHGYIELTKRLTPEQSGRAGLAPESVAEEDLLDTPWLERLRRISQLQSARWVCPTAEHSRFTHGLGVMHEAGLWGRALYPTLREVLLADTLAEGEASEDPIPSEPLVVETLRMAGLLPPGRRPRPLRPFLRRARPGALPRAATSQPRPGEAPQPRGSRPGHHRARTRGDHRRAAPGTGPAGRAGRLRRGRGDRAALDRLSHLRTPPGPT